jgi:hypothetical protein
METRQVFRNHGMNEGRIISQSKSDYKSKYPDNQVYFNANIFTLSQGKIWWGDLDITRDIENLKSISIDLGEDLFILKEIDGRFENENISSKEIISRAVSKITK